DVLLPAGELIKQVGNARNADMPGAAIDQPPFAQVGNGPGKGLRLDRQASGNQALRQHQFDLGAVAGAVAYLADQVQGQALGGVLQGQVFQLVQPLVQAHAHVSEQVQAG